MEDVTSLILKVDSRQVGTASGKLDRLERSSLKTEKATDRMAAGFKRLIAPLVAVGAGAAALRKLTETTREFDVLNASLKTATGSAEGAEMAFEAIQDFASTTPYALQEVTTAFVKLVNLGLDPSERALTSYGDTAAAMGKSLDQMIEAVADATTGEFERLKEFGIRAKSEGDNVTFTFRGVSTTIRKEAAAIEEYLTNLGEINFAGAMAERMDTLDGALSNFADEWDKLWLTISQESPIGDAIETTVRKGIAALESLRSVILSLSGNDQRGVNELVASFDRLNAKLETATGRAVPSLRREMRAVQLALGGFSETEIVLARAQNGLSELREEEERLSAASNRRRRESNESYQAREEERKAQLEVIQAGIAEAEKEISLIQSQIDKERELAGVQGDRLSGFGQGPGEDGEGAGEEGAATDGTQGTGIILDLERELELMEDPLLLQRERLLEEYEARQEMLQTALDARMISEEEFQARSAANWDAYKAQVIQITTEQATRVQAKQLSMYSEVLGMASTITGQLNSLAAEGSDAAKALFYINKAISIAQAVVYTELAAARALAEGGIVFGIPMSTMIRALGYASVGLMAATTIAGPSGKFESGGILGGNQQTGDQLTFRGNSGEMILNFSQQKKLLDMANGTASPGMQKGMSNPTVNVYNLPGQTAEVETNEEGQLEIVIRRTKEAVAGDLLTGTGVVNQGVEAAMRRKGVA